MVRDTALRTRETRLRRRALLLGYVLEKSRCRTPSAREFGMYRLYADMKGRRIKGATIPDEFNLTLDDVERNLQ